MSKKDYDKGVASEKAFTEVFYKDSVARGKALEIILPLVSSEKMAELLAELYDSRVKNKERVGEQ